MVNYKYQKALNDEKLRYSVEEDFNMINESTYLKGLLKIQSIFIQFVFTVYLVANTWLVFVELTHDLSGD